MYALDVLGARLVVSWCVFTWEGLLIRLGNKLMQVPPNPGGGVGLPRQQPTRTKDGCIPSGLGLGSRTHAHLVGAGCRLMGPGPLVSAQLKQPANRRVSTTSAALQCRKQTACDDWMAMLTKQ